MTKLGTSLKFGTSGLRGLSVELQGQAARQYVAAFLRHVGQMVSEPVHKVYLGRDFRPSSLAILHDCSVAIAAAGLEPVDCGALPTPALALHAIANGGVAVMITGSHIPADRNGLKFYLPTGEISKADEAGIVATLDGEDVPDVSVTLTDEAGLAVERYLARFTNVLPPGALAGKRIGVFEHSTVARDLLGQVLRHYGAETVSLGRIEGFVPVDTEAFGDDVFAPVQGWIAEHRLDALLSADGDGDRPLLVDEKGQFVRGDVLGLLTARYLKADCVVTPVTSNTAIEGMEIFGTVTRTRVGSPFVVAAMDAAEGAVIGFEANGGTFVGRGVAAGGVSMPPLVTRDAILPILCALGSGMPVSQEVASLPLKHALADRLQNVPSDRSAAFLDRLRHQNGYAEQIFGAMGISGRADIDGLQFWTEAGDMVHFRASGNAPELRCYVEGNTPEAAQAMLAWGMATAGRALQA